MDDGENKTGWRRDWAVWAKSNPALHAYLRSREGEDGVFAKVEKRAIRFLAGDGSIGMAAGLLLGAAIMAGFAGLLVEPSSPDMINAIALGQYGVEITVGAGGVGRVLVIPQSSENPTAIPCPVWASDNAVCVKVE